MEKQMKKVRIVLANANRLDYPSGAHNIKSKDNKVTFEYVGKINELTSWLASKDLHDAVLEEPDLESIFMNYYER